MNALILAAGFSNRMGSFKPLLELGGKPVIRRVIDAMRAAGADYTAVVTGHNRARLLPYLDDVTELYNSGYAGGMFTSVQTGIRHFAERGADYVLMTPADYPLISVSARQLALSTSGNELQSIVIPCFEGEEGHPVSLPAWLFPHILAYDGDSGLRRLLAKFEGRIVRVEVSDAGAVLDMDTPEDYLRFAQLTIDN